MLSRRVFSLAPVLRTASLAASRPMVATRFYSEAHGLDNTVIKSRIFEVLGSYDKVKPEKITETAKFTDDLGLDSLDAVEVVMSIEEEFGIEIPDEDADRILTVADAIEYISKSPDAA